MHNILFDPRLLMIPAETAPRSEIEAWFDSIETWAFAHTKVPYREYHMRDLIEKHLGDEPILSFTMLRNLQKRYKLDVTLPTIAALINNVFLQDTSLFRPTLDAHLAEHDLIVEPLHDTLTVQPCDLAKRWPTALAHAAISLLAEAGVGKSKGEPFSSAVVLATIADRSTIHQFSISGNAMILSTQNHQELSTFSTIFPIIVKPEDLVPTDLRAAWDLDEYGVRVTIEREFQRLWQSSISRPLPYTLGPQFLASIRERGIHTNKIVLSKIVSAGAAVIANTVRLSGCGLHPLGETASPNSPQRIRAKDGAKAWRLHLVERGAGWRMHYWHIPGPQGGCIEFSNILKKHEEEIIFE